MSLINLYQDFYNQKVLTFSEILKRYGKAHPQSSLRSRVRDLLESERIGSVKRGLYYIVPQGMKKASYIPDKFLVGIKLSADAVIGYHSALELHGASYSSFKVVYVITQRYFRPFESQGTEYRAVTGDTHFGIETVLREGLKILVTDRERTLVEGIDRLKYVGGLEEYFKSIELFPSIDFDRVMKYLARYNRRILYAKVGFLLSHFQKRWGFPENYRKEMKAHLGARINYLSDEKEETRLNREWKLMVPVRLKSLLGEY